MILCISQQNYLNKPLRNKIGYIKLEEKELTISNFTELLKQGYAYTSVMNGKRNRDCFACTQVLTFDIDGAPTTMDEYIKKLPLIPSICYTTSSNKVGDYRFRLLYIVNEQICDADEYQMLSRSLAEQLGLGKELDTRSYLPEQLWFGCYNCSITNYNITYSKEDIIITDSIKKLITDKSLSNKECKPQNIITTHKHNALRFTSSLMEDYRKLSYFELLEKYNGFVNMEKSEIDMNEDEPLIYYPSDYYEIRRPWKRINGETKKIGDGENRRKHLFLNGLIRRRIYPSITADDMLLCMVYEFSHYYLNNGNKITKETLLEITENVMNAEIADTNLGKPLNKAFVNPLYCAKHHMTKKEVLGMTRNKQRYIEELFNPCLTDKENLAILKENGITISRQTLAKWKRKNGFTKK